MIASPWSTLSENAQGLHFTTREGGRREITSANSDAVKELVEAGWASKRDNNSFDLVDVATGYASVNR